MAPAARIALALAVAGMALFSLSVGAQDIAGLPAETLAQSVPVFAFQSQGNHPALIFSRSGNAQEMDPRVFVSSRDGSWRLIGLGDELHNTVWVYAGRMASGGEVWGITQSSTGVLQLVSSGNDGRSWKTRGSLQKISKAAVVDLFSVHDDRGTLILRLDADSAPDAPRLGYYLYLSKNGGRAWSEAIYSQGKPLPPPNLLAAPDRAFDGQQTLDTGAWQRLLADLQPAG